MSVKVYVASNEQLPWTSEEIGMETLPMPTKAESGYHQVGDYHAEIDGEIIPICFERKSLQDFYGSTIPEKNRLRLYKEIMRFDDDPRFDEFVIIVEATEKMYMQYFPWAVLQWHNNRGDAQRFCGMIMKKKATVLSHLRDRGGHIFFAGDRAGAASVISTTIAGWISEQEEIE